MNCLRGFQAAARYGSFSRAAKELHMTQSAVSHQIKTLEEYLRQPLFIRVNRKVKLTDAGQELLTITDQCLETLGKGLQRLEHFRKPNQLILHTDSAFASNWLVPRLCGFRKQYPGIDLWLYTTDMAPDLELAEVHIAILYGRGDWPGLSSTPLLADAMLPLCSPSHPIMSQAIIEPADLLAYDLLHGEQDENWHSWFASHGMTAANPVAGPNFSNPAHLLQTAVAGHGIALGSIVLATDLMKSGQLVCPIHLGLNSKQGYHLVTREDGLKSRNSAPFRGWLEQTVGDFIDKDQQAITVEVDYR